MRAAISNLVSLLQTRAEECPDQPAYIFLSGTDLQPRIVTYSQLDFQARTIAAFLQRLDLQGERVLLLYPPGLEFVAGFFGCLYAGVIAVPAYPPRLNRNALRIVSIAEDSQSSVALTTAAIASRLSTFAKHTPEFGKMRWVATDTLDPALAADWRPVRPGQDSLAYLQYTSGSTGAPRGVMVTHANVMHNSEYIAAGFEHTAESVSLCWLPHFHDMGLIDGIIQPLYSRFAGYLMSPASFLQEPAGWLQAITRYRVTHSGGPNFAYELCCTKVAADQRERLDLSSWKVAYNGAEPVHARTLELFAEQFAPCGFRRSAFYPAYGLAEATLKVSGGKKGSGPAYCTVNINRLEQNRIEVTDAGDSEGRTLVGAGCAAHGVQAVIVDPESHLECSAGAVGEIWICGPSVAAGYWNRQEESQEVFAAFLKSNGEGPFLRSGDLGFIHDGEIFVTGRLKDLIIIRGRNHYPQDIERTVQLSDPILRGMPGAAFPVDIGTDEKVVIVQEVDSRRSNLWPKVLEDIRKAVAEEHEIQPYAIVLLKPGSVPRTSSGKVQRQLCRQQFLANSLNALAEWRTPSETESYDDVVLAELTADSVQLWLRAKFAAKLRTGISEIAADQPIHQLGLDSLMALEIAHSIEDALGVSLSQSSLLEGWTVAGLADHILSLSAHLSSLNIDRGVVKGTEAPTRFSLSQGQQALLFLQQLAPESRAYNIARALRLKNELDAKALQRAFQKLVDRHASLRAVFSVVDGRTMQDVCEPSTVFFRHEDASRWKDAELSLRVAEASDERFDLSRGPLFRVFLFSRSAHDHVLLLAVHHIVSDLWSLGLLLNELSEIYAAEIRNLSAELPLLTFDYADYVRWEEELLQGEEGERHWEYWRKQLQGELPCLELPTDFPRPPIQTYKGANKFARLDTELLCQLKSTAVNYCVTLHTLLIALFEAFLHRYSGQEDVLVGTPTAGRSRSEFAGIVGYFVNPVVIRMDFSGDPSFEQAMVHGRRVVLEALEHQAYPFATLVQRLQPQRDSSRSPIFQAMFVLQRTNLLPDADLAALALALGAPGTEVRLGEMALESVAMEQRIAQFDLTLAMAETDSGMVASFEYNIDLFEEATVERMMRHFERLLRKCVADPPTLISEIPLLSDEEYRQIVVKWNRTEHDYAAYETVLDHLEAQAQRTPDNPAVIFETESLSYRELHQQANQLARFLQKLGVRPEVAAGVCMQRSAQMVIALLGIVKAGGAYIPLDPGYPAERLNYMLSDAQPAVVIVDEDAREKLQSAKARLVCLEADWEAISTESQEAVKSNVSGGNLAYVIYTSGSTGQPKGVMNVHCGLLNRLQWMQEAYGLTERDRVLQKTPFGFDVSVWEFFWPLMYGARLVVARPEGHKDSQYLVRTIQEKGITTVHFVPSMLAVFLQEKDVESCSSLRRVIASGEALSVPLMENFHQRLQTAELHNLYGPTEASIDVSYWACPRLRETERTSIPIGRPIANTQLYILDSRLQPVPVGIAGELHIGGVALSRGYLRKADLTAEKFIPDPFSGPAGERLYRTGDLTRWREDGNIEYLGRIDGQVKLRGFRIELGEIEAVVAQHEAVQQAVVALQEAGQEKRLIAYVLPAAGVQLSRVTLRAYLQEKLPEYMVPAAIVELKSLPLSAHGKVNRKALPKWEFERPRAEYQHSRTPTEELLAGIWSEVLGVHQIGLHDNFFELGGHSLLAAQVASRVREIFLIDLPLHAIFEAPTLPGLSQKISGAKNGGPLSLSVPISHVEHGTDVPLSFAQERMWFLQQIIPDKSAYNMIEGVRLSGELNIAALEASLQEIIRRHDVLRASFASVDGRCVQKIYPAEMFHLEISDLQKKRSCEEVRWRLYEETRKPFDLAQAPLLRATLLRSAEDEHILLLAMHHLVADGWSYGVLLRELKELYRARIRNERPGLGELQIQYADYARWQRQYLAGEPLENHLDYWKTQLADAGEQLLVPADHPRPALQSFRGRRYSFELSKELSDRLKELSRQQSVTLFMTLLSGLKILLARYANQQDITVGSVVANRNLREVEGLVGLFANTLVLRSKLNRKLSVVGVLTQVREVCLGAFLHQEVPFEKLVAELEPERDLSRSPIFQVMFAWQILPLEDWQMEGLTLARLPVEEENETTKFDLSFLMGETQNGLIGVIEYSADLFEEKTVRRMFALYHRVLEAMVRESNQNVWELSLLSEAEREQLLVGWNCTRQEWAQGWTTVVQMIEQQVAIRPTALAVRDKKQELTYRELNQLANQWAYRLRKLGVQAEARVAICMQRSAEMVAAELGVLKARGAYIPLDHEHPAERLQYQISDSGVKVLITERTIREKLNSLEQVQTLCVDEERDVLKREPRENPGWKVDAEQLAYVIYTSGSTGRPKGVEIEHRGLLNLIFWHQQAYGIGAGERGSQIAGIGFDASVWETWPYLAAGASLEIAADEVRGSAQQLRDWLTAKEVTICFLPTPLAEAVMRLGEWTPERLKRILTGGDRLHERPTESWAVEVVNHYGPTECTVVATGTAVEKHGQRFPAIGRPITNTQVYVMDEEMQPVPVGVAGELYIGGAGLARGYAGKTELTAEWFVPDGLSGEKGQRLYRTGDQCRWNEAGELEFLGRKDEQVKIRGHRIEVGEIETTLKEHPRVRDAVIAVQERETAEKALIAYVVTPHEREPDVSELRHYLQSRLPSYMVPSAFVQLESIPLTASGKVNRQALKKWEFSPVADQQEPRTDAEARLAEIWKELLRLKRVGIHDSFFELGGDSIISLQVVARAQQQGIRITARQLFESPTIAALAAVAGRVEAGAASGDSADRDAELKSIYPLSPMQKGMLFEYISAPESGVYVQQLICTLKGRLEIEAFKSAWQQVVERHTVLRTFFIWERVDEPLQRVSLKATVPFEFQDWTGLAKSDQQEELQSLLAADRARGFTLSEAPLLRITLAQIAPDVRKLLLTFHHLILDGWSLPRLFKELFARYREQIGGEPSPALAVDPYSDYVHWLEKQDHSAAEAYWRQTLEGFGAPTNIGIKSTGRFSDSHNLFFEQQIQFSSDETARLQTTAKQQGITLSILVQAAWAILLSRYSGEEDIVFGLTVSGRSAPVAGMDERIGLFINTLPVRSHVQAEQTLPAWLKELQARQIDLSQYEHTPLFQVQKWSEIPAGAQLFESILVFENYPLDASFLQENNGLIIEEVEAVEITNYPVTVTAIPHSGLKLLISYDRKRFDDDAVTRMLGHVRTIFFSMAAAPQQYIREVAWITPTERTELLVDWNQTATAEPLPQQCVHKMFEDQARRSPGKIAVTFSRQRMNYAELNQRANQLAFYLRKAGVGPEVRVGIYLERGMEIVVAVLAVAKAGGAYVPLDPNYPSERIQFMFRDAQATVAITQSSLKEQLEILQARIVVIDEDWKEIAVESEENLNIAVDERNLAYVIYTSGSTGRPKGVSVEHRNLMNAYQGWESAYQLSSRTAVHLQMASFSFDVFVGDLVRSLCFGKTLVICPTEYLALPDQLFQYIVDHQVDAIEFVPVVVRNLATYLREQNLSLAMDLVVLGSDLVTMDDLFELHLCCSDHARIVNTYGVTECTIDSSYYPYQSGLKCAAEAANSTSDPIGKPLANTCLYVLDSYMQPVPVGIAGELYIGGAGVARGYCSRPKSTAERFLPDPFSEKAGNRLYRTGDVGRWMADGNLEFLGRADQQVKIRGYRIEPGEIEVVLRAHTAARDAVVTVHEQQLVAYVVGDQCDQKSLCQHLKESLPEYMIPAHFVFLNHIPTLPNGKVDRRALPAPKQALSPRGYVGPRNAMEETLAAIWSTVLKVEQVGIDDNFFELGGDSIISLQVVARARQQGIRITPRQLFETRTIAALAAVAQRMGNETEGSQPDAVEGEVALTPIQRWFFEQQYEELEHYNQALIVEATEELKEDWLGAAWKELAEHHDALRLRYRREAGEWRQRYAAQEENEFFRVVELNVSEAERERELALVTEDMQKSLNLERGPLLRVTLVKPGRIVVVIHHLAVDGVSWRILLEDLETAYTQLKRGEKIHLPAKTSSYQRWAEELERRAEAKRDSGELEHWLRDAEREKLPRDWAEGKNREQDREYVRVELEEQQTHALLQEVPGAYHTQINDVLLAAVTGAWEKWTGKQRLLIDVEAHGRGEELDLSRTVGWFTTVYPVRLEVGRGEGIGERLKGIKEQIRIVPGKGLGYGVLRYLNKDRAVQERWRKQAEAEISFNYLGQVDVGIAASGVFRSAKPILENNRGKRNRRSHLLEVEARVERGRLGVEWNYSREVHRRETIEALAQSFVDELRQIIEHCLAPGAGGFTLSDFPLAELDQQTLDLLVQGSRSISDIYPLSPVQQGLLFHTLYEDPHSGTYIEQLSCTLEGDINIGAFERAWQEVIDCHPALRSGFSWDGLQESLQVVHQSAPALFIHHDWRRLSDDQRPSFDDLRRADAEQGFDLARPPLMRFTLARLPDRFEFLWSSHHLLLDGWSMSLVVQEMLERYEAICAGKDFHAVWRRPYREYIAWVRQQDLAEAAEYWKAQLKGFSTSTALPGERVVSSSTREKQYSEQQLTISEDLTHRVQTLSRQHQVTLSVLVQAAWAFLLKHYTGQRDLVFGVTVSGRPPELAGIDQMVGMFINTVPLRLSLASGPSVVAVLKELQDAQLQLDEYAYTPLSRIQEWSEIPAGLPLFETILVFENYPVDSSLRKPRGGLQFSQVRSWATSNYPLTLIVKPDSELTLQLTYDARRFESGMVAQLLAHLQNLLAGMAADPMKRADEVQPLSLDERQQLLVDWNRTAREYPCDQGIQQLFEQQVGRVPQNVAVIFQDQKLSYAELNLKANQLAHYLQKQGVSLETRVGVCMDRSLEMIVALLGIVKAGGVYVALDAGSPPERVEMMLAESGSRVVATQQSLLRLLPKKSSMQVVCVDEEWERIARESSENPEAQASGEHLAYVSYTSGSTGRPKGVSVPHRAVVRLVKNNDYAQLGEEEVILQFAPLAFDASTLEIWGSLLNGGRLVVMPPGPQSTEEIGRALVEFKITTAWLTAGLFQVMVDHQLQKLKQVKQLLAGGDVLSVAHVNRYLTEMSENAVLINGYGPTENTTFTCCYQMTTGDAIEGTVPIGRPIGNTQVYVLNEEMQPVAVGVIGELYIGGQGLARGYENDVVLTAQKFVPHPYGGVGERLYRSGDEVRWRRDGVLEFVGRVDRQVKIRGYRVEPAEIESVMMRNARVREAVVTVLEKKGREKSLVAYVVAQPGGKLSIPDLQSDLKTRLPDYMRPAAIMLLDKLPLTANGKVDLNALPALETAERPGGLVLPRTPVEHALAEIWHQVFAREHISVEDNFFDLGGHSLLALQIASRVRTVLRVALPLRSVFEEPTIAEQAQTVERLLGSGRTAPPLDIHGLRRPESLPLSFAQQRLWFLHQLEPTSDFYNVPIALRIRGPLDAEVLSKCFSEIVHRHEILRTIFPIRQGMAVQQIDEAVRMPLEITDLSQLPSKQAEAEAAEFISSEARRAFDLAGGPLLRLYLLRLGKEDHILLFNMHHIIVDGWSLGIFTRELAVLYEAFLAGRSSPLPSLSLQYADYALWQREWLNGDLLESQLAYWRQQLSDVSTLDLHTDCPRPKVQTFRGVKKSTQLSRELVEILRELARREHSTLFMVLLAALKVLLYRYTGQPEITVGTPVAGRTQPETEDLIGFFVNTLALRTKVLGRPRFPEFLRQVREVSLRAYAHQDLPFEKLVEELHPERDDGRSPIFQVMFALEDTPPQELLLSGLRTSPIEIENQTSQFDLTLTIRETFEGLRVSFQYNSDLFHTATMEQMMQHFDRLLREIAANSKQSIAEIPLLSDQERREAILEWNQAERDYPAFETVLELLEAQAQRSPDTPAVIFEDESLSYRDLHQQANQLARFLQKLNVGPEVRVGVCMERSTQMAVALLGIMKAGGAYLPLDPSYPAERLNYMLSDARPAVVIVDKNAKEKLWNTKARLLCLEEEWAAVGAESREAVESRVSGENLVYVIYTSGSTGKPKGVGITNRGLHNHMSWMLQEFPLDSADRLLQKTTFSFDASVWEFWVPLIAGAVLVMARPGVQQEPESLIHCLQKLEITILQLTPTQLRSLLEQHLEQCQSLHRVFCGGEALSQELVDEFCRRLPWVKLYNLYGPTEATIDATFSECAFERVAAGASLGGPIANTQAYVVDCWGELSPIGVPGELWIGGTGLARGYINQPGHTAESFLPDPFSKTPGARLYKTGDLARRRRSGELDYLGRIDHQVKLRGYRIELGEIETLLRQHPEVAQAAVTLREYEPGDKRLMGFAAAKNGTDDLFAHNLRDYLRTKLPEYMVPEIVQVNQIPLSVNGKIDYNSLPATSSSSSSTPRIYIAPRNAIEEQLEKACCDLLGIQRMSVHDNFFDLGGHSLLAMRLMTWTRETFQVDAIPLREFFETPTIAGLAALSVRCEARPGQTEKIAKFLQQLNAMSAEQVLALRSKDREQEAAQDAVSQQ